MTEDTAKKQVAPAALGLYHDLSTVSTKQLTDLFAEMRQAIDALSSQLESAQRIFESHLRYLETQQAHIATYQDLCWAASEIERGQYLRENSRQITADALDAAKKQRLIVEAERNLGEEF